MSKFERLQDRLTLASHAVIYWLLDVVGVTTEIGLIMGEALNSMIAVTVESMLPLTKIAELEGRNAQLIDDIEHIKELYSEQRARIERLEIALDIEPEAEVSK